MIDTLKDDEIRLHARPHATLLDELRAVIFMNGLASPAIGIPAERGAPAAVNGATMPRGRNDQQGVTDAAPPDAIDPTIHGALGTGNIDPHDGLPFSDADNMVGAVGVGRHYPFG